MTDIESLWAAIMADHHDDLVRLAYADALEESGELPRAEVIRLDMERWRRWPDFRRVCVADRYEKYPDHYELEAVENRLLHLFQTEPSVQAVFKCDRPLDTPSLSIVRGLPGGITCTLEQWEERGKALVKQYPITEVRPYDKRPGQPEDAAPLGPEGHFGWWGDRRQEGCVTADDLPNHIWKYLDGEAKKIGPWKWYETEILADAALSRACVLWAHRG